MGEGSGNGTAVKDQPVVKLVDRKRVFELLGIITEYEEPEIIKETAKWAFTNNKKLSALPVFINSLVEIDYKTDLKKALDALNEVQADWLNDLPEEDSTAVMEALVDHLNDHNPNRETKKIITNVLAMLPQKAVDILNKNTPDRKDMIEMIKKIIDEIADP